MFAWLRLSSWSSRNWLYRFWFFGYGTSYQCQINYYWDTSTQWRTVSHLMFVGIDCKRAIDVYTQIMWLHWRRPGVINVSSRPRHQDLLWRDRDETRDPSVRDRDETETMRILIETRPRRDADTSRDRLETETSRPRLHPWLSVTNNSKNYTDGTRRLSVMMWALSCPIWPQYTKVTEDDQTE